MPSLPPIDFVGLALALLDRAETLVPQWLPDGEREGHLWYVGNFDGGKGRSANVNLKTGGWGDNGSEGDSGRDLISLYGRLNGLNNGMAARELMELLGWDHRPVDVQTPAHRLPARAAPAQPDARPEPPTPETALAQAIKAAGRWQVVVPVPAFAPAPRQFRFGYRDKKANGKWVDLDATKTWEYRFNDRLYGYVARFERVSSEGEVIKQTVPLTWCEDSEDAQRSQRWHWKIWPDPRPLYVPATLLSHDGLLPVVIVEGEKCAEAGHVLLGHEFDFVSWPGGCKTWALALWSWLAGRTVYLWPDSDAKRQRQTAAERQEDADPTQKPYLPEAKQPGMQAMVGIGNQLLTEHGCTVFMCNLKPPGERPDGWDIADAIAEGWDAARVRDFIRGASVFRSPDEAVRAVAPGSAGGSEKPPRSRATAEDEEEEKRRGWNSYLLLSATGSVKAVRENVVLALDGLPGKGVPGAPETDGLIAFNQFTNNVEKTRPTPWGTPAGPWQENDELDMGDWLVWHCHLPSMARATLEEAVVIVAHRHAFHPVRERVVALRGKWDKVHRLDTWLRRACLEEDEYDHRDPLQQYLALAGKWFLMGLCARVLETVKEGPRIVRGPGTKFDYMLVLESPQGWGKSTFAAVLGGDHFADTGLILGDKDSYQNIQGILVYEWGELESLSIADVRKVKSFISSWKDRFRASFDRRPRDYPRQVVFVGTTNESHYLTDVTGNRRFWPVRLTMPPDQAWMLANLEQLLAEALHRLDAKERFWPTREEQRDLFDPQQRARVIESSLESSIRHFLYEEEQKVPHGGRNGSLITEISMVDLLGAVGYTIDKQTDAVVKKAGALLHALDWTVRRAKKDEDGRRPRVYVRPPKNSNTTHREAPAGPAGASSGSTEPTQGEQPEDGDDDCPF